MQAAVQDDGEIMAAVQRGDSLALGILYGRYGAVVYRLALRILQRPQDAEDLTQEIFLGLEKATQYNPNRGNLLTFLMTLTRSRALNRIRQGQSQGRLLQRCQHHHSTDSPNLPMENATVAELSQRVAIALETLPPDQRRVLELAYYEGLSQSEITQRLQIPLGTVKTRSRQGLLKLKNLLQDLVE